jgi:hypothetical protein
MRLNIVFAAVALASLAAQPATARSPIVPDAKAKPAARQCFWANRVNNFAAADENTLNVRVGMKDVYQFEMLGRCPDIDWSHRIAILSRGSNSICTGLDAEIIAPSPIGPQRCAVRTVRKLTPDEIKALPRRAKP